MSGAPVDLAERPQHAAADGGLRRGVSATSRSRRLDIRRWLREPLLHFVLIGLALYAASALYARHVDVHRIVVTPQRVAQLANGYALQFGERPDPRTLEALVDRDMHDEILFREGRALGLDVDDEIVRRRVIQKMQFLSQDLNPPAEPSEAQLQAFFRTHAARYAEPARLSFTHVYFAPGAGGAEAARQRALSAVRRLGNGVERAPELGDPFPDAYDYANYDAGQLNRLFGAAEMARALFAAPVGRWVGPVRSAYGWHLVRITARTESRPPQLAAVRDRVRTDYLLAAQDQANRAAFERLARRYRVVRQDRGG